MDVKFTARCHDTFHVYVDIIIDDTRKTFRMRSTGKKALFKITVRVSPETKKLRYAVYTDHVNIENVNMRIIRTMRSCAEGERNLDKEREEWERTKNKRSIFNELLRCICMEKIVYFE